MRKFLGYFLPPLIPVIPLLLLAVWVAIEEAHSPVRIFDGRPDNAPIHAVFVILVLSPIIYFALLAIHFICLKIQRGRFFTPYFLSICICSLLLGMRAILAGRWVDLGWCACICFGAILPMAICSWLLFGRDKYNADNSRLL